MFEDLDWKGAFRRAAFAAALYLLFVYVMSKAFPQSFGGGNLTSAVVVALIFFFVYAPLFAFTERRKRRRLAEIKAREKKGKKPGAGTTAGTDADGDEAGAESLRGRHNPNTSRKKAARRRRR